LKYRISNFAFCVWLLAFGISTIGSNAHAAGVKASLESLKQDCAVVLSHLQFSIYRYRAERINFQMRIEMEKENQSESTEESGTSGKQGGGSGHGQPKPGGKERPSEDGNYPSRKDQSTAKNINTDNPPATKPPKVLLRANIPGLVMFKETAYAYIDPILGKAYGRSGSHTLRLAGPEAIEMEVHPHGASEGPVLIPHGYDLVRNGQESVRLTVDDQGNGDFVGGGGKPFKVLIEPAAPVLLTPDERRIYTKVPKIPLRTFPEWLLPGIDKIKAEREQHGLPANEVKQRLEALIDANLYYRKHPNNDLGILEMCHSGAIQCSGASRTLVYLLRSEFQIPARVVDGSIGHRDRENPDSTVIVSPSMGHSWADVYDDNTQRWELGDATPSEKDGPDKEEDKKDKPKQQYSPNANSQGRPPGEDDASKDGTEKEGDGSPDGGGHHDKQTSSKSAPQPPKYPLPTRTKSNVEIPAADAALLHAAWLDTLQGLSDSRKLYDRNALFREMVETMREKYPKSNIPYQYERFTRALSRFLAENGMPHRSMKEVVELVTRDFETTGQLANDKLLYVEGLLNHLESARSLSDDEKSIRGALREVRSARRLAPQNGHMVPIRLPDGPGGKWFREHYTHPDGAIDWTKVEADVHSPRLKAFLAGWRASKSMNLAKIAQARPTERIEYRGRGGSFYSGPPDISQAPDLDNPETIMRDGLPPSMDSLRLVMGDLLQLRFPEEIIVRGSAGVKAPRKEETYVLQDMSSSMEQAGKWIARNALVQAYLNNQKQGVAHDVYDVPYDDNAGEPKRFGQTVDESYSHYLNSPNTYSRSGNNAANAFEQVFAHLEESTGLKRVNILWLTDAEETIDIAKIERMRKGLRKNIEVRVLAVNIGEKNPDMERVARQSIRNGNMSPTKVTYMHVNYDEVQHIVSGKNPLEDARLEQQKGQKDQHVQSQSETTSALFQLRSAVDSVEEGTFSHATLDDPLNGIQGLANGPDVLPPDFKMSKDVPEERRPAMLKNYLKILAQTRGTSLSKLEAELTQADVKALRTWLGE
jgi:hypothetical protein